MGRLFCRKMQVRVFVLLLMVCMLAGNALGEVNTMPGVSNEMLFADYWDASDSVVLTAEEIEHVNAQNAAGNLTWTVTVAGSNVGVQRSISFSEARDALPAVTVRSFILSLALPSDDKILYAENGEQLRNDYWTGVAENRNLDRLRGVQRVRYGWSVVRSMFYQYPCDDLVMAAPGDLYFSETVQAELMPCEPLLIYHESQDGEYLFVACRSFAGWVHKDTVAECESREQWLALQNPEQFIVVTGNGIHMGIDPFEPALSNLELPMGTKLKLCQDAPRELRERMTYGCYVVELPLRNVDGSLRLEQALIPMHTDVHEGYLEMTSQSILAQAFKMQGQTYGWAGTQGTNDCSGVTRQIMRCYGLMMPRNSRAIYNMEGLARLSLQNMTKEEKLALLGVMPAGSILYFPGHIMIYLGMRDGEAFVISALGSYANPDQAGLAQVEIHHANCMTVSTLNLVRRTGLSWLESITGIIVLRPKAA